jgi:hypothetical protein
VDDLLPQLHQRSIYIVQVKEGCFPVTSGSNRNGSRTGKRLNECAYLSREIGQYVTSYLPFTSLVWNWVWNSHDHEISQLVYVRRAANDSNCNSQKRALMQPTADT